MLVERRGDVLDRGDERPRALRRAGLDDVRRRHRLGEDHAEDPRLVVVLVDALLREEGVVDVAAGLEVGEVRLDLAHVRADAGEDPRRSHDLVGERSLLVLALLAVALAEHRPGGLLLVRRSAIRGWAGGGRTPRRSRPTGRRPRRRTSCARSSPPSPSVPRLSKSFLMSATDASDATKDTSLTHSACSSVQCSQVSPSLRWYERCRTSARVGGGGSTSTLARQHGPREDVVERALRDVDRRPVGTARGGGAACDVRRRGTARPRPGPVMGTASLRQLVHVTIPRSLTGCGRQARPAAIVPRRRHAMSRFAAAPRQSLEQVEHGLLDRALDRGRAGLGGDQAEVAVERAAVVEAVDDARVDVGVARDGRRVAEVERDLLDGARRSRACDPSGSASRAR